VVFRRRATALPRGSAQELTQGSNRDWWLPAARMSGNGASRPYPCVMAKVPWLIRERVLGPGGTNWSSCALSDLRTAQADGRHGVDSGGCPLSSRDPVALKTGHLRHAHTRRRAYTGFLSPSGAGLTMRPRASSNVSAARSSSSASRCIVVPQGQPSSLLSLSHESDFSIFAPHLGQWIGRT
jgi:hypothetical protein